MDRAKIIKQMDTIVILGKMDNITNILRQVIEAGYGHLPAIYAMKLYLERN